MNLRGKEFQHRRFGFNIVTVVDNTGKSSATPSDESEALIFFVRKGDDPSIPANTHSLTYYLFNIVYRPYEAQQAETIEGPKENS